MAKSKKRIQARQLRNSGQSIKEIAENLSVSTSSVSVWCRNIQLSTEQIRLLQKRRNDPFYGKRMNYIKKRKIIFDERVKKIKNEGVKTIGKLTKREIFLIGVALYWGEGFKKDHLVGLASSDVNISKFFIYWLKTCFNIPENDLILRVTANISYIKKIRRLEKYWSKELKIAINQFSKPYFQKSIWKKEYENKDTYHGVLRIKVRRSVNILRKIYGFIEGVADNIIL